MLLPLPCFTQQSTELSGLQSELARYLNQQADSGFGFSVLVAMRGKIVVQHGYGWIDSVKKIRTTDRTLFNIASITKSFTATAIYYLASKKLISLDDTLPKFFRDVPGDKRSISITELLTHASDLPQHYVSDGVTERDSAVRRILNDSLSFAPGTGFSYSNENYELLGAVIEVVTHQSYESAIGRIILNRANMTDTRFWTRSTNLRTHDIASMNRKLDPAVLVRNWGYIASGGLYSNVADLYLWFTGLYDGTILDSMSRKAMWAVQRQSSETGIASGWFLSSFEGKQEIWTRGSEDWGHNGVLRWFPDEELLIIVLSNSGERGDKTRSANRFISDGIARIIFQHH